MGLGRSPLSVDVLEILGEDLTLGENLVDGSVDPGGRSVVSEVGEHESGRSNGGDRVGESETLNVGGRSVNAEARKEERRRG